MPLPIRQRPEYHQAREEARSLHPFSGQRVSDLSREARQAIADQDVVDDRLRGLSQIRFSERLLEEIAQEGHEQLRELFGELTPEQIEQQQPLNYHGIVTELLHQRAISATPINGLAEFCYRATRRIDRLVAADSRWLEHIHPTLPDKEPKSSRKKKRVSLHPSDVPTGGKQTDQEALVRSVVQEAPELDQAAAEFDRQQKPRHKRNRNARNRRRRKHKRDAAGRFVHPSSATKSAAQPDQSGGTAGKKRRDPSKETEHPGVNPTAPSHLARPESGVKRQRVQRIQDFMRQPTRRKVEYGLSAEDPHYSLGSPVYNPDSPAYCPDSPVYKPQPAKKQRGPSKTDSPSQWERESPVRRVYAGGDESSEPPDRRPGRLWTNSRSTDSGPLSDSGDESLPPWVFEPPWRSPRIE